MAGDFGYGSDAYDPGLGGGQIPLSLSPDLQVPYGADQIYRGMYNPLAPLGRLTGSAAPAPATPVATPSAPVFDLGFGDSITSMQFADPNLGRQTGRIVGKSGTPYPRDSSIPPAPFVMGETAAVGDPPSRILDRFRYTLAQNPDYFRGKNVFATSGSNDTSQLGDVATLVSELKRAGATSVVMPGVGPGVKNSDAVNTVLAKSVADAGGTFFQPQLRWQKDGVHPASGQDMYDQAVKAYYGSQPVPPVTAPTAAPGASPTVGQTASLQPQEDPQNALVPPPLVAPAAAPTPVASAPVAAPEEPYTGPFPDIYAGAKPYGVDPSLMMTTASIESDFGRSRDTNTPGKTYRGIFQLGPSEWEEMGGGDRDDRALQIDHGAKLLALRKQQLAQSLGREPTNAEVYLAHQQGVAGATALINNPNMPAGQAVTMAGGRPANIEGNFRRDPNNPSRDGRYYASAPSSEFVKHWENNYNTDLARVGKLPAYTPDPRRTQIASSAPGGYRAQPDLRPRDPFTGEPISAPVPATQVASAAPSLGPRNPVTGEPTGVIQPPNIANALALPPASAEPGTTRPQAVLDAMAQKNDMERRMKALGLLGALQQVKAAPTKSGYDPSKVLATVPPASGSLPNFGAREMPTTFQSPVTSRPLARVAPLEVSGTGARTTARRGSQAPVLPEFYSGATPGVT
jgi:hypothetical protein